MYAYIFIKIDDQKHREMCLCSFCDYNQFILFIQDEFYILTLKDVTNCCHVKKKADRNEQEKNVCNYFP